MTAPQAELLDAALAAFRARDSERLWELMDPEAEFHSLSVGGEATSVYRGREGIDRYFADVSDVFDDWHTEDERHLPGADGRAASLYRVVGRGRGSGIPIDLEMGIVWTFRDGRILRGDVHPTPADALSAAGIEPATSEEGR